MSFLTVLTSTVRHWAVEGETVRSNIYQSYDNEMDGKKMIRLQAHRGVAAEYPENTMAAFNASVEQGYHLIELDPKYTSDGQFVFLHDKTLNRTARNTDGSGLGLSIAKSLAELQHGTMELAVDGDLFKVILTFPVVQQE